MLITGRERHVHTARPGYLPYPQRSIRRKIINSSSILNRTVGHWEDPYRLDGDNEPSYSLLENRTFVTLADEDAGPTKAWIVTNRNDPESKPIYKAVYGKRPKEELYDLKNDPDQMNNLAANPKYAQTVKKLRQRLMKYLRETKDPSTYR